jgi:hypothetical protein
MTKDCVLLGAWIPSPNRIDKYINVLVEYYGDCDIYVGINPCQYQNEFIQCLERSGLNVQHASANQLALKLYRDSGQQYRVVHFLHTKGISYDDFNHQRAFDDYYVGHAKSRPEITSYLISHPHVGGYCKWGMNQPQWFCKKGYTKDTIPYPWIGTNFSMAQSVGDATKEVHPYFDLSPYCEFDAKPLRTQYLIAIYAIKDEIVRRFVDNCSADIFEKNIYDLGYDMYFFETHFPQIISRFGYLPYIETIWNLGNFGTKKEEQFMIDLWKEENKIIF